MTFQEIAGLTAHWKRHPPAHIALGRIDAMVAHYLGVERRGAAEAPPRAPATEADVRELVALAAPGRA
jgi:hypothetical protein